MISAVPQSSDVIRFGRFTIDRERRGLYAEGTRVHLTPKPLETLIYLAENAGRCVSKQELLDAVWTDTSVTEGTLVQAIREIRRVLDDDRVDPRFIQTVPRHGYRFVGTLTRVEADTRHTPDRVGRHRVVCLGLSIIVAAGLLVGALTSGLRTMGSADGSNNPAATSRAAVHPAAQQAYLRGRFHWNKRTKGGFHKAIEEFRAAIEFDPDYALPYAGLADTYVLMGYARLMPAGAAHREATRAILKALEIDNGIPEVHVTLGRLKALEWEWADAERAFQRAIELNPKSAAARHWYANHLTNMGRHDEAIAEASRALALDPASVVIASGAMGAAYLFAGRYDAAVEQYRKAQELDPAFPNAHALLGLVHIRQRRYQDAVSELRRALALHNAAGWRAHLAYAYAAMGERVAAAEILRQLEKSPEAASVTLAAVHVALREPDRAFELLNRAVADREPELAEIRTHLVFDLLREDPRFQDLLRRMHLSF